ncbi:MAG: dockerin type I repeat-containing protein [Planctomycetota bacterium]
MKIHSFGFVFACMILISSSFAHEGRRFDISVIDGQLVAQGYNNGAADGAPAIRPYANALHDHFTFFGTENNPIGFADLPSYDLGTLPDADIAPLVGFNVNLTLISSGKWVNVPAQDGTGLEQNFGIPELLTFDLAYLQDHPAEMIQIGFGNQVIDTMSLGSIQLTNQVSGSVSELDFEYFISSHNQTEIYFIEWQLNTNAPGVQPSDSVFTIMSPDGMGPVERMHFQSLHLEEHLGIVIGQFELGDVNQDGNVDLLDVSPFVDLLTSGDYLQEADVNQDGSVDLLDVSPFVELLTT